MGRFIANCIRSRWITAGCAAVVVAALVLPANGLGVPLCQFKLMTHLPCFGCGMTRSFIDMAHLRVTQAGFYNPAGVLIFPIVLAIGVMFPASTPARERIAGRLEARGRPLTWYGWGVLAVFLVNGIGRIAWLLATHRPSPW